jgi:hypothetical protein
MKRVRDLATVLYYLSRIIAILVGLIGMYVLLIIILSSLGIKGLPIDVTTGEFVIFLPFSKIPFLLGDYNNSYLSVSISILVLYAIFLWLLSRVFKVFKQQKIFIPKSVRSLRNFYLFNFYIPLLYLCCLVIFRLEFRDALIIVMLHLMISVFIYFMATIFQQGLVLQEEQDQTL